MTSTTSTTVFLLLCLWLDWGALQRVTSRRAEEANQRLEEKNILDYIFHSPALRTLAVLDPPSQKEVGPDRLPSLSFPSDHLSLVADIKLDL